MAYYLVVSRQFGGPWGIHNGFTTRADAVEEMRDARYSARWGARRLADRERFDLVKVECDGIPDQAACDAAVMAFNARQMDADIAKAVQRAERRATA